MKGIVIVVPPPPPKKKISKSKIVRNKHAIWLGVYLYCLFLEKLDLILSLLHFISRILLGMKPIEVMMFFIFMDYLKIKSYEEHTFFKHNSTLRYS